MMDEKERAFWMTVRQAVIMVLCGLEAYLDLKNRTIVPKRKRATYGTMYSNTSTRDVEEFSGTD